MSISSVFFVDSKGRLILGRNYMGHLDLETQAQRFFNHGIYENTPPIFNESDLHFMFICHNSLHSNYFIHEHSGCDFQEEY
jgi:hypothetical protein